MKLLWAAEVLSVLLGLVGVALIYLPASLIVGGVLGVLAAERAMSGRREDP